jgi:hypothetical protein
LQSTKAAYNATRNEPDTRAIFATQFEDNV